MIYFLREEYIKLAEKTVIKYSKNNNKLKLITIPFKSMWSCGDLASGSEIYKQKGKKCYAKTKTGKKKLKYMGTFLKVRYVADQKFEMLGALKEIIYCTGIKC